MHIQHGDRLITRQRAQHSLTLGLREAHKISIEIDRGGIGTVAAVTSIGVGVGQQHHIKVI